MADDLLALFDTPASPAPSGERMCASCGNVPTSSPRTNTCARCAAAGFEPGRLELDAPAPAELVDVPDPGGLFGAPTSTPRPVVTPPAKRGPRCSFCGQRDRDTERCAANLAKLNPPATCPLAPPARRPEALALDVGPGRRPHDCTPTDCAYPCTDLEGVDLAALLVLWCDENALTLAARTLREAIRDHEAGRPRTPSALADAIEYARRSLLDDWPIGLHESAADHDARIAAGVDPHDPATWDGPAEADDDEPEADEPEADTLDPWQLAARAIGAHGVAVAIHAPDLATAAKSIGPEYAGGSACPGSYLAQRSAPGIRWTATGQAKETTPVLLKWREIAERVRTNAELHPEWVDALARAQHAYGAAAQVTPIEYGPGVDAYYADLYGPAVDALGLARDLFLTEPAPADLGALF